MNDAEILAANDRLAEKRARLAAEGANVVKPKTDLGTTTVRGNCACGAPVSIEMPTMGGTVLPVFRKWVPKCGDCIQRDEDAVVQAERDRKAAAIVARQGRLMDELAIPALFADATLDSFRLHGEPKHQERQETMRGILRAYLDTFPRVALLLLLRGIPGTGKGHFTHALARGIVERHGVSAKLVKLPVMVRDLRASWAKGYEGPSDETRLAAYLKPEFLVLDEVSEHAFYGQNIHQHLYDVIDARLEAMRPTILTSNESDDVLQRILRPALMNRLEGEGGILEFDWPSYRTNR